MFGSLVCRRQPAEHGRVGHGMVRKQIIYKLNVYKVNSFSNLLNISTKRTVWGFLLGFHRPEESSIGTGGGRNARNLAAGEKRNQRTAHFTLT